VKPKICLSIKPRSVDEVRTLQRMAEHKGADFVEIRLDHLRQPLELKGLSLQTEIPRIAANRTVKQGGAFTGSEDDRFQILLDAAHSGFDYIDLEDSAENLRDRIDAIRSSGVKTIISNHNLESTPPLRELKEVLRKISKYRPDICKIVTSAKSLKDNLVTLGFLQEASRELKLVCFAMGEQGKISRIVCPIFGSFFTIASLEKGAETAPGQLTIDDLRTIYERMSLN
jgi:3-dehydroquinate dehydratase/shikimate dehydrogenase